MKEVNDRGCNFMVEHLTDMYKALGLISSTVRKEMRAWRGGSVVKEHLLLLQKIQVRFLELTWLFTTLVTPVQGSETLFWPP